MKWMKKLSVARIIALSFATAILVGALLLCLPIASADGQPVAFSDAMFTATTSICVTGLVTVPTFSQWSVFGQAVVLCLIQLGGLGVVTCSMVAIILIGKRITIRSRKLIQESYNLEDMSGMVRMIKRIVAGTFLVEGIGAICYMFRFVPEFGWRGIWISVFNAISAFCNAGIDIIGPTSLREYATDPLVNITTMGLIVVAGLGFVVWWDLKKVFVDAWKKIIPRGQIWQRLQLHTKIVLVTTAILIFGGASLLLLFEYHNPETIGNMNFGQKIMACLFQSVTTRTAGFETIPQNAMTDASGIISMLLMLVGGSPMGTAGGIKTTTIAVLVLTTLSYYKGNKHTNVFHRQISEENRRTATVVTMTMVAILFVMIILLSAVTGFDYMDVSYEIVSGIATVGLTRGITSALPLIGKYIVIVTMYIGRIGPLTLATAVAGRSKESDVTIERPEKKIMIG